MKSFLKNFRTAANRIGKPNLLATMFLLAGMCLALPAIGQTETDPCAPSEYPFIGAPEATLCDQYGNLTCNVEVGSSTLITHSSQLGTTYTGNVCVKGTFYIDNNFKFINCIVKIDPGSTIIVLPPHSPIVSRIFTIDNSKLFACSGMWNGIQLSNNTAISTKNNTVIEDAIAAIKADNIQFSVLLIEKTTFNRNQIGILLVQDPSLPKAATIAIFNRNKFTCTAPLNGTTDQISYAGVKTVNVPFTVNPVIEAFNNRFVGLQYGIVAEGASTAISGRFFRFEGIRRDGIFMENGILNLSISRFTNCEEKGINVSLAQELRLSGCSFIYDETISDPGVLFNYRDGVYVKAFGVGSSCVVSGCSFDANLTSEFKNVRGLHFAGGNVGGGTHIVVNGSSWNFVAVLSEGIYIPGAFPSDSQIDIFDNTFNIKLPYHSWPSMAIRCLNGDKYDLDIIGNVFTNAGDTPGWETGVQLYGSEGTGNQFSNNDFPPPAIFQSFLCGVDVQNFKNTKFCFNVFYNASRAFCFFGQNDNTDFVANVFNGMNLITIYGPSWIDDQNQKGNTWMTIPGFPLILTPQAEMDNAAFAPFSEFLVHTPQSTSYFGSGFYPYHPRDIVPDVDDEWWRTVPGIPESGCVDELTGGGASKLKMDIADGLIGGVVGDASLEWQAKRGLYRILMKDPDLVNQYPSFAAFLSAHSGSVIGKLYEVSEGIENAITAGEGLLGSVQEKQGELEILLAELLVIDSILETSTDSLVIAAAIQDKSEKTEQLLEAASNLGTYNEEYRSGVAAAIGDIRALNNSIATTATWESDEKTVNGIYLDYLETGALQEGQAGTLTAIGQKCPKEGGMAVYKARGILPDCIQATLSDDYAGCYPAPTEAATAGIEERSSENTGKVKPQNLNGVNIFPNPTTGEVQFSFPGGGSALISVTDNLGKALMERELASPGTVRLEGLAPGTYFVHVRMGDGSTHIQKLLLVK